jgi:hypothetical protein
MSSYIPEKTFVVCTKQMGFGYKKLLVDGDVRTQITVILKTGNRPFLTIADRKIDEDFACQTQWASVVAWGAFGAGAAVGICVLAAIPVFGWIGLGIVAGAALLGAAFGFFSSKTKCSDRLKSSGTKWVLFHPTVTFDNFKAINKKSILQCQEGGSLLPFISESLAQEAANAIALRNIADVGINGLATFVSGLFATLAFGEMAAWKAIAWFGGGMLFGQFVINPATEKQREIMRSDSDIGGDVYTNMNQSVAEPDNSFINQYLRPDVEWNPKDFQDVYNDVRSVRDMARESGASREQIAQLERAIQSAERTGSFSAKKNPEMAAVIENIKRGVYGEKVKSVFTNKSGNMRGMIRRANVDRAIAANRDLIQENRDGRMRSGGKIAGNALQIIQPFASTYFSERAREYAAMYAQQDMSNGVGVLAYDN